MSPTQYLLQCLQEECAEVTQASSKANRFGLKDEHEKNGAPNDLVLWSEVNDLAGIIDLLLLKGIIPPLSDNARQQKRLKVERMMEISRNKGMVQ